MIENIPVLQHSTVQFAFERSIYCTLAKLRGHRSQEPYGRNLLEKAVQDRAKDGAEGRGEDAMSSLFPELSLALQEDKPNPRK